MPVNKAPVLAAAGPAVRLWVTVGAGRWYPACLAVRLARRAGPGALTHGAAGQRRVRRAVVPSGAD